MRDYLARFPAYFPSSTDRLYTLKEFLDNVNNTRNNEYNLPIIVNITSLNTYGRSIKNILTKNTPLLLLKTHHINSILVEYHRLQNGRQHSHRHRLTVSPGKMATKATTKFRKMRKSSKSASLNTINQTGIDSDDDQLDGDNDDSDTHNQRNLVKSLNEKRSTSVPLCRVPKTYQGFFELLNENDRSIEPYHKLTDLIIIEYDTNDPEKRIEKWPHAFFLRSTCTAYTRKSDTELSPTTTNDNSPSVVSTDSCYGSLSDLDSQKNLPILNDEIQTLQPGQILTILADCYARRTGTSERELKAKQQQSSSPSPSTPRTKSKSIFSFLKKRRHSHNQTASNENISEQFTRGKAEAYLKCRSQQGDILYISFNEYGLFSPLNCRTHRLKSNTELNPVDVSGVFQLKDLLSNFRFPISVRLLNNSISFDNNYSPAVINQHESSSLSSTKFRLLLPYTEQVIFACPLIIPSSFKSQIIVIPIPLNSNMEIQRCLNMREISKNKSFHDLIQTCHQIINRYKTEFSYIHFPLVLNLTKRKQPLFRKKRSQSESHLEYLALDLTKDNYRKSCELFNNNDQSDMDEKKFLFHQHQQLHHRDSVEKIKEKLLDTSIESNQRQQTIRRSGYYAKLKMDKPRKYSRQYEYDSEDENYRELDHIYDYIRSGDITDDVQRIQAKEQALNEHAHNNSKVCVSTVLNVSNSAKKVKTN